jgi:hypothetical protein
MAVIDFDTDPRCAFVRAVDDMASSFGPEPGGAALLWGPSPAGPSSSALASGKGRSTVRALDLDRANAAPGSYVPGSYVEVPPWRPAAGLGWLFGLAALARPGEGKNQGAPSGRRLPPEGGLAWS